MFGRDNFRNCVADNLKKKGYGEKKTKEFLGVFERKVKANDRAGMPHPDSDFKAMHDTLQEVTYRTRKKLQQANKNIAVAAQLEERIKQAYRDDFRTSSLAGDKGAGFSGGMGSKLAVAAKSILVNDRRTSGRNLEAVIDTRRGLYFALMGDVLDVVRKGALGIQKGVAHLPNITRELYSPGSTGDAVAKEFAQAYKKLQDYMIDDFNRVGGDLRKRLDFNLPQWQNAMKVTKAGVKDWIDDHMRWLDWDRMFDEEGNIIPPEERLAVLRDVYGVIKTDGAANIRPDMFGGRGASVANSLKNHRFLVFKDADAWNEMHAKYGDGSVFEVIVEHINDMARKTSQVDVLGTNPSMWLEQAKARVRAEAGNVENTAASLGKKKGKDLNAVSESDQAMRRVEDVFTTVMHKNSMNPDNSIAAIAGTTSNLLQSAQLTGAVIMALPGDALNMAFVRFANKLPVMKGMQTLLTGLATQKDNEAFLRQSGFIIDEMTTSTFAAERFTGLATYGAPISRRISDVALRLSLLNRHTNNARGVATKELMGLLARSRDMEYEDLPFQRMLWRNGVTKRDWDVVRKLPTWQPVQGAHFMRPLDIMNSNLIDRDQLYQKFAGLIHDESRQMVPASTVEAQVALKNTTRPDSAAGLILHSFAMYKNFPVTLQMMYGRMILDASARNGRGRTSLAVGMLISMTMAGALGIQLRELLRLKTPQDMTTPNFWGRALMAGGGLGIWGEMLFNGINSYGRGISTQVGGPLFGAVSDVTDATIGQPYAWVTTGEIDFDKWKADLVRFGKRYTPGSNIWWARPVLERELWNRLEELADPKIKQKRKAEKKRMKELYGNEYFIEPGERIFTE